jgi:secreted PhoX family phosphatase
MTMIDQQEDQPISSNEGQGETFEAIVERRSSRRTFLKGAVAASAVVVGAKLAGAPSTASAQEASSRSALAPALIRCWQPATPSAC